MTPESFKLDFAIIGVQKSATTALASYLAQHPQLYLPETKETHYFRRPVRNGRVPDRDVDHLLRHYTARMPGQKCGDATPAYIYWPRSMELLFDHNSKIRSVLSIRNPILRAYSAWSMEVRRGRESLLFSEAIREGRSRVRNAPMGVHPIFSYVERGFYYKQITGLLDLFPQQQVFVLRSDAVTATEPRMQALLVFLDVAAFEFAPLQENLNPGIFELTPELQADFDYLFDLFIEDMRLFQTLGLVDISDWLTGPPDVKDMLRRAEEGAGYA